MERIAEMKVYITEEFTESQRIFKITYLCLFTPPVHPDFTLFTKSAA
jgi:hypothetical protein